jgi:hypothetical protein
MNIVVGPGCELNQEQREEICECVERLAGVMGEEICFSNDCFRFDRNHFSPATASLLEDYTNVALGTDRKFLFACANPKSETFVEISVHYKFKES